MKPVIKKILFVTALLLILIITGGGYYFSSQVITPNVWDYDKTYELDVEKGFFDPAWFKALPREEVYIESPLGYKIHALYFPVKNSKKTIIFAHGFNFSLMGSVKYMNMFFKRGYNVLAYDHRYHGKSGGENISFGYYEKHDLKACVDWVEKKTGKDTLIGVHGESMGAAVALQHGAIDGRVDFYIVDGSFSTMTDLLKFRMTADFGLPHFPLFQAADLFCKLRAGFSFSDVSPLKDTAKIKAPVLFMHGGADTYIPPAMCRLLFEHKKTGPRAIYITEKAGHSLSFTTDKKGYERAIARFLKKNGFE